MSINYPAETKTIRSLTPRYNYFLVIKGDKTSSDINQLEYFVYRFKVSTSNKIGINEISKHFGKKSIIKCNALSDTEYATGNFTHPYYTGNNGNALLFRLREIPIYMQETIGKINTNIDKKTYGSKPIIKSKTASILEAPRQRINGNFIN